MPERDMHDPPYNNLLGNLKPTKQRLAHCANCEKELGALLLLDPLCLGDNRFCCECCLEEWLDKHPPDESERAGWQRLQETGK